jgi:hypothetical protein
MIKIFPSGSSLLNTPFTDKAYINYFSTEGISLTQADDADLIIGGTFQSLLKNMMRFGRQKAYLLWSIEPRFSKHFQSKIRYPVLPGFHVLNVYTGSFADNYLFAPQEPLVPNFEGISEFKNDKQIVSLMTYQAGPQWRFLVQGIDVDLCNLRTKIALSGYAQGILDIYGKQWPEQIKVMGRSRGKGWHEKKISILHDYHFNLCFENTNWPYYCTEKIWDSIQGGCLPIYYGRGNQIYDDFPRNSFLDYCDFNDPDSLFDYIQNMTLEEFKERMMLCIETYNRAVKHKQEKRPYEKLLERTVLKIREIFARTAGYSST